MEISEALAIGDAGAGEAVAKRCASCHTFEQGEANKIGPNLWSVLGREIGRPARTTSIRARWPSKAACGTTSR